MHKIYLPEELKNNQFVIIFQQVQQYTIFTINCQEGEYIIPIYSGYDKVLTINKEKINIYCKDDPLIISYTGLKDVLLIKNLFNDKIQVYNFNFDQVISINARQLFLRNNTIYLLLQSEKIEKIQSNFDFQIENIYGSLVKIRFKINQDYSINSENILIRICCNQIYENPLVVYFKYLYEQQNQLIENLVMQNILFADQEIFFVFCWGDSLSQQYYRYSALLYARIYTEEELETFYQQDNQSAKDMFKFTPKEVNQPIKRETELCLVLFKNQFVQLSEYKLFIIDDINYVQVIDLDFTYQNIQLVGVQDKIIQFELFSNDYHFSINDYSCKGSSQFYSNYKEVIIFFTRLENDYTFAIRKLQITIINQKVELCKIEQAFEIVSSEWIAFQIEQMFYYQLTVENQKDNFQIDYWLSTYELLFYKCTKFDQNLNSNIDGALTPENSIIRNKDFKFLYLKASPGFDNKNIQFKLRYYNKIEFINHKSISFSKQTLSLYLFDIKYQRKVFKMAYSNTLNFQISKCQTYTKSIQHRQNNIIQDESQINQNDIKNSYIFIYPEMCAEQHEYDTTSQDQWLESDKFCLQIEQYYYQTSFGVIQKEKEEKIIQKLELNQTFNIQLNSETQYIILEVENKYDDHYLYLEYKSIEGHPVFIELRNLVNKTQIQRFYFQQHQQIHMLQLQSLKYLEIYNYQQNKSLDLILILSKVQFQNINIYQNKIQLNSLKGPFLLLLSRFENQSIVVYLQNSSNTTTKISEQALELHSPKNIYIFCSNVSYTIKQISSQTQLEKQFYLLEVSDDKISISINKNYYFGNKNNEEESQTLQFFQNQNIFKFKIDKLLFESMKGFNIQNLQNKYLYFLYSKNKLSLVSEYLNGVNSVNQYQNLVVLKEKVLEINQIDQEYEITTTQFQKSQLNIWSNYEVQQYFRIYIQISNSSMIIPISQIFQQPRQLNTKNKLYKIQQQIFILAIILIILLLLIYTFLIKIKNLQNNSKSL
ncbi:transmembrane protein, putative (macronuclear) [Tetrahymena thermophila SB210]|uniref:Transmembrane protein, putative n=1 Tax=Tetrahymena thermophila (strain SB210) TaxID=312017 RepID=I7LUR6_TETTS|nr:transmembrane protein, putative [Tetrahymena thermophila SB210]EAR95758.2 transmembrane protein, putative [Tetrahymena thermophila SB210]|eukprot:XP_001016003.2 transmembrane protein, putative [Tetrahymena thermophila SB210]